MDCSKGIPSFSTAEGVSGSLKLSGGFVFPVFNTLHMQREAADCEMFLCSGSLSTRLQSSAMEIPLGLNTLLHSAWTNQVVSELLSSYAAWLDNASFWLSLFFLQEKIVGRASFFVELFTAAPWHLSSCMYCKNAGCINVLNDTSSLLLFFSNSKLCKVLSLSLSFLFFLFTDELSVQNSNPKNAP